MAEFPYTLTPVDENPFPDEDIQPGGGGHPTRITVRPDYGDTGLARFREAKGLKPLTEMPESDPTKIAKQGYGFPEYVAQSVLTGLGEIALTPRKAQREGLTPEEEIGFGGAIALSRLPMAMPKRGQLGIGGGAITQPTEVAPPFYSTVAEAVANAKQTRAPAAQWEGMLRNTPGVKPEELDWLGVGDWLRDQKGPVSKQDLGDYVRAHQVDLKEVQKGEIDSKSLLELERQRTDVRAQLDHERRMLSSLSGEARLQRIDEMNLLNDRYDDLGRQINSYPKSTRFSQWQLPGGENYREMLLRSPVKEGEAPFVTSHWPDDPNTFAHVRFNDRTIDGKKTLFLEEIQSDWHQKGREQGYKGAGDFKRAQNDHETALRSLSDVMDQIRKEHSLPSAAEAIMQRLPVEERANLVEKRQRIYESDNRYVEGLKEVQRLEEEKNKAARSVPDAPFKTTWPELALKRMIRYAADNGYEKIAWTPGDVQAARYDLSQQVRKIEWSPVFPTNQQHVTIDTPRGLVRFNLDEKGTVIDAPQNHHAEQFVGKPLNEVVGKEVAEKITGSHRGALEGEGLRIGGEGMKGFYDKMLPAMANKLGKKYGAKVDQKNIVMLPGWPAEESTGIRGAPDKTQLVHSLDITPALRDTAVRKGFALFSGAPEDRLGMSAARLGAAARRQPDYPATFTPVEHDPFAKGGAGAAEAKPKVREGNEPARALRESFGVSTPRAEGTLPGAYRRTSAGNDRRRDVDDARIIAQHDPDPAAVEDIAKPAGIDMPVFHELHPESAAAFHRAISDMKAAHPSGMAVDVYSPQDYAGMRLFTTPDAKMGFAIKPDGNIVSVFKHPDAKYKNGTISMLEAAVQQGGRKLDAFDTVLPHLYSKSGFRVVSRTPFDPASFDQQFLLPQFYDQFKAFNNGRPDVVFMAFDPRHAQRYRPGEGPSVPYDQALVLQDKAVAEISQRYGIGNIPSASGTVTRGHNMPPDLLEESRVSTRLPTAKRATEDPLKNKLTIGMPEMMADPEVVAHNARHIRQYKLMPESEIRGLTDAQLTEKYVEHMKNNLLWLHDHPDIDEWRNRATHWYEGGRRLVDDMSNQYGMHPHSAAGAMAALSPQNPWFNNVSQAFRVADIVTNKQNMKWSPEMDKKAKQIFPEDKMDSKREGKFIYRDDVKAIRGKKLSDLTDSRQKAMWVRTYDEAHNPRNHHIISPEGDTLGFEKTKKGEDAGTAWFGLDSIEKAIGAIEAKGDIDKISLLLSDAHKVRNFYNNLIHPNSPSGDVTIDTHAVGAAHLKPMSATSAEVIQNFGSNMTNKNKEKQPAHLLPYIGGKRSAITGVVGTYGLQAEAYRRAATARGILPRQMQSITWEAIRSLFPQEEKKSGGFRAKADEIWHKHNKGEITADEAREQIYQATGGKIQAPDWHQGLSR